MTHSKLSSFNSEEKPCGTTVYRHPDYPSMRLEVGYDSDNEHLAPANDWDCVRIHMPKYSHICNATDNDYWEEVDSYLAKVLPEKVYNGLDSDYLDRVYSHLDSDYLDEGENPCTETVLREEGATAFNLGLKSLGYEVQVDLDDAFAAQTLVYVYEHSGIALSTSPFSCRWDSGRAGTAWIPLKYKDEFTDPDKALTSSVESLGAWMNGEVYYFMVIREEACECCGSVDEEDVDSCYGFIGDRDCAVTEGIDAFFETSSSNFI